MNLLCLLIYPKNYSKYPYYGCPNKISGRCKDEDCDSEDNDWRSGARSLDDPQSDALQQQSGDGALMASYSVFVVEPGEDIGMITVY